jgi:hypothetical protein
MSTASPRYTGGCLCGAGAVRLVVRPVASYYTGSKCNWWEIRDALPRFDTA